MQIVLAGSVDPAFKHELDRNVSMMREAGAAVDLRNYIHSEMEGLDILAKARCAVLPYPRHYGMSRVLVEACSVGTPVIAHNSGLIGHLVRRHGLGVAVDCKDQGAFREALITFTQGSRNIATYSDNLAQFAARFSKSAFEHAATAPFATSA
jgi:glycosyltransferase involved in cell wall biosynthesis